MGLYSKPELSARNQWTVSSALLPFRLCCSKMRTVKQSCVLPARRDTRRKVICLVTGWKKSNIPCWSFHWNCSEPVISEPEFYTKLIYKLRPASNVSGLIILSFWGLTRKGEISKEDPSHWTKCFRGKCCEFSTCTQHEIDPQFTV